MPKQLPILKWLKAQDSSRHLSYGAERTAQGKCSSSINRKNLMSKKLMCGLVIKHLKDRKKK